MRRSAPVVAVIAGAAVVAAAAARPAAVTNPCKLVTQADAKTAIGGAGKGQLQTLGLYQSCTYRAGTKTLTVQTRRIDKATFVTSAKANPKPVVAVHGIGSAAYSAAGGFTLLVWKDEIEATFSIFGAGSALPAEEALARRVVGRL